MSIPILAAAALLLAPAPPREPLVRTLSRQSVQFEANGGHHPDGVRFVTRGAATRAALGPDGIALFLRGDRSISALRLVPEGACVEPVGESPLPTRIHYLLGDDPAKWSVDNATYTRVRYPGVWRGIDLVVRGRDGALEYDFELEPGADPDAVVLRVDGALGPIAADRDGRLIVRTSSGTLTHARPEVFVEGVNGRRPLPGRFVVRDATRIGFEVEGWDGASPLVIDPVLDWASYFGGNDEDRIADVALTANGSAVICGYTESQDLPVTAGAFDGTWSGYTVASNAPTAFVAHVSSDGQTLLWCTYLGGTATVGSGGGTISYQDRAFAIDLDSADNPVVGGETNAPNFPTTAGAFQTSDPSPSSGLKHGFVAKLAANGASLLFSSYWGNVGGNDVVRALQVGPDGGIHLVGQVHKGFPVTAGAFQTTLAPPIGGFVAKLSASGAALTWSAYVGNVSQSNPGADWDDVTDVAVDASGRTYLVGRCFKLVPVTAGAFQSATTDADNESDLFLYRVSPDGSTLEYGTLFGGSDGENRTNRWMGVACNDSGRAWICGATTSSDLPVTAGAHQSVYAGGDDGFVACFDTAASGAASLVWSTYFGANNGNQHVRSIALDVGGRVAVMGAGAVTLKEPFLTLTGEFKAFHAVFDASGVLESCSGFGGNGLESTANETGRIRHDQYGYTWMVGVTTSTDLALEPVFQGQLAGGIDGYVAKISPHGAQAAAATVRLPCAGAAPPQSLVAVGPAPVPGTVFQSRVQDPTGATGFTNALTTVMISLAPDAAFPCGTLVPGHGGAGQPGELLVSLTPGLHVGMTPFVAWSSPSIGAVHSLATPPWAILNGLEVYTQGIIVSGPAWVLTEGLDLRLGY